MKVCFFAHYSKDYKNGATLSLINIANEMASRDIKVIIIIPNKNIKYPINNKNIKTIFIPSFSMRTKMNDYSFTNKVKEIVKTSYNWLSIRKALRVLKNENLDVIHINGIDSEIGAEVALKLKIPYVWHIRQLLEEDFGMRIQRKKAIYKLLNKAGYVIAISKTVKEKFEKILNRDLTLIYNGIPVDKYRIENKRTFSSNTIEILLAGRIVKQKAQLDAVKAINQLIRNGITNVHLTITGNIQHSNYFEEINRYIKRYNLHKYIKIIDFVSDLRSLRKRSDIGLVCSKKEAFGRVTIETMVSRMLVIGANTGGTAEIISNNYNGLLYEEGDYLSLANCIKYAIEHKFEMKNIIENGYSTAIKYYSISGNVDYINDLYNKLTSKN